MTSVLMSAIHGSSGTTRAGVLSRALWTTAMVLMGSLLCCTPDVQAGEGESVKIYAPASPTSIPLILAAEALPGVEIKIFTNHSQAHALFLKGDVEILCTGLAVGVGFFRQGVPVRIISSHVSGMTWLVSDIVISRLGDLRGTPLYLPFPGSPMEEVTRFFARAEGLILNQDIVVKYISFPGAVALLQQGRIRAAALPEPFVSLALTRNTGAGEPSVTPPLKFRPGPPSPKGFQRVTEEPESNNPGPSLHALSYKAMWEKQTSDIHGYPQVGTFVHQTFATTHASLIDQLNKALDRAIREMAAAPGPAVQRATAYMDFSGDLLYRALQGTDFYLWQGAALKQEIQHYYQTIGAPLNENFDPLF